MRLFDSSELTNHFFHDVEKGGLSFFILCWNNNDSLLFDFFLDLFLYLNQLWESYPVLDDFEIFLDD